MDLEFQELINFVNRNKVKNIEILGSNNANNSMVQKYYLKLCENAFTSEQDAAEYFFETDDTNRNYKELKKRLKKRLLNTVLFIDVSNGKFTSWQKEYYAALKDLAAASILHYRGMYNAAVPVLLKLEKKATKNRYMDILVQVSSMLASYYSVTQQNLKKLEFYMSLLEKANKGLLLEFKALEYIARLQIGYSKKTSGGDKLHCQAQKYYQELEPFKDEFMSFRFHFFLRVIENAIYTSSWEINKWYESCKAALCFFKAEMPFFTLGIQHFLKKKIECCLLLGKYHEGTDAVSEILQIKGKTALSIIDTKRYQIQLLLHTREYQKAYELFISTQKRPNFKGFPPYFLELWRIIEAYLNYLILLKKINLKKNVFFNVGKFINEVPEYSKEKTSGNIPILIIQILFLIQRKQYTLTDRRLETLNKYRVRYLEQGTNVRSKLFIKMFLQIPKANFEKQSIKKLTNQLLNQLEETTRAESKQAFYTEIIPYEHLWDLVLESVTE